MAHRKLREKPCGHTKWKPKHMAIKTKSPAMCKTGHEHAANENTHKPHVHKRHDNIKARSQWKTPAASHTAQDITWMHAPDKNTNCVQHKHNAWGQKSTRLSELETAHSHKETWSAIVRSLTRNLNSRHEGRDLNTMLQHETRHADERVHGSSTLEAACSHITWHDGSVRALSQNPWMPPDRSDRTLTETTFKNKKISPTPTFWTVVHIYEIGVMIKCNQRLQHVTI